MKESLNIFKSETHKKQRNKLDLKKVDNQHLETDKEVKLVEKDSEIIDYEQHTYIMQYD